MLSAVLWSLGRLSTEQKKSNIKIIHIFKMESHKNRVVDNLFSRMKKRIVFGSYASFSTDFPDTQWRRRRAIEKKKQSRNR